MRTDPRTTKVIATLRRYQTAHGWRIAPAHRAFAFVAERADEHSAIKYYFQLIPEREQFLFYIVPELRLFEELLTGVAEYVCRANAGLRIGNFEPTFAMARSPSRAA